MKFVASHYFRVLYTMAVNGYKIVMLHFIQIADNK
jgi:hypothetical protein